MTKFEFGITLKKMVQQVLYFGITYGFLVFSSIPDEVLEASLPLMVGMAVFRGLHNWLKHRN